ncbi:MAG: indole-3-glycerol-phosphate synthase TrpC, partial [Chloroflexota bacterium]
MAAEVTSTGTILDRIVADTRAELAERRARVPLS